MVQRAKQHTGHAELNPLTEQIIGAAIEVHRVELKLVKDFTPVHQAPMLSYLKSTGCPVGLLLNFNVLLLKHGIRRFSM